MARAIARRESALRGGPQVVSAVGQFNDELGDRPTLLDEGDAARRAVEAVWRIESARIVGALTRSVPELAHNG
jgi:hypothetical protein